MELTVGFETRSAAFSIAKDPRLATSPDDYAKQFALLKELYDKLSTLNGAVNRIRLVRRQLFALTELLGDHHDALVAAAKSACERLTAIESVLIDIRRESPRDTLRHPAGLNDTLIDMINTAAIADMAPTVSAVAVSQETMTRVDAQIANLDVLLNTDIVIINRMAAESSIAHIQVVI